MPSTSKSKDKLKTQKSVEKNKSQQKLKSQINEEEEPIPITTNVFLYVHLQTVENLPERDNKMLIRISHVNNIITKLEDQYSKNTDVDLTDLSSYNPTFSITIQQDSIEDLNAFSDSPLLFTLYEYVKVEPNDNNDVEEIETLINFDTQLNRQSIKREHEKVAVQDEQAGEEEDLFEQRYLKPIAQGIMDLVPCFTRKRIFTTMHSHLYPIIDRNCVDIPLMVQTTWHVYSLLPLLKELTFGNIAFITFESIYNATSDLVDNYRDLNVNLSFQSKIRNENYKYDQIKLCSYSIYEMEFIDSQNPNQKWESLKTNDPNSLGLNTGCKTSLHKLFNDLLHTEGVNFRFEEIDVQRDLALIGNTLHRYILTNELVDILEDVVAFNQQHLLVEVYRRDRPEMILMQGILDLSVLLYPQVNACRFAVELCPPNANWQQKPDKKSGGGQKNERTTFAIIGICLLTPITEKDPNITQLNENHLFRNKLKRCQEIEKEPVILPLSQTVEDSYKTFDELIGTLIDFIANNNVKNVDDAKAYFCCQMGNLKNNTLKLIAIDFNKRFPTNTSIEFTNLMTTVYEELVGRAYNILQNCNNDNLAECYVSDLSIRAKIINFMNISKYMYDAGNEEFSIFLLQKIRDTNKNNTELNFYTFLYDIEKQDYNSAKEYLKRPKKEKWMAVEYYTDFVGIYIQYMNNLENETSYNESLETLLKALHDFINDFPQDKEHWILLHCLYRKYSFLPGESFTRWKYENLYDKPRKLFPATPKSRWELYINYEINFRTEKGIHFFEVVKLFANLGMYKFVEIVFNEIANECADIERHLMTTTLKILLNEVTNKTTTKTFGSNTEDLKGLLSQVNGHLEYFRGASDAALRNYERILDYKIMNYENFELSLMRLGNQMLAQQEFQQALRAFEKCRMGGNGLIANIGMGKALYGLQRLKHAEHYFAASTNFEVHIPDVWAYLALINLKMGNNFKALEFWKYAKLNPDNIISEEILQELSKINYKDVFLYVDKPL